MLAAGINALTLSKHNTLNSTWLDSYLSLCFLGAKACRKAAPSMLLIYNEAGAVQRAIAFTKDLDSGTVVAEEQEPSEFS